MSHEDIQKLNHILYGGRKHVTVTESLSIRKRIDKEIIKSVIQAAHYETNLKHNICCWTCMHYRDAGCRRAFEPEISCFSWTTWSYRHFQPKTTLDNELFEI